MATSSSSLVTPQPQRPGPNITPLAARPFVLPDPVTSVRRSYPKRKKIEVLLFLMHHRIYDQEARESEHYVEDGLRRPYIREAAAWFKIRRRTISNWWNIRDSFDEIKINSSRPYWPELEDKLWAAFIVRREQGLLVRTGWFRRQAQELFEELYPDVVDIFDLTEGWFNGFKRRKNIVPRRITKQASKPPAENVQIGSKFLRFIRRVSQPRVPGMLTLFPPSRVVNLDETPVPFEYLDGSTYDTKGVRTVAGKTDRSGWSRRQATLIPYIFADGVHRIKPTLIFHGRDGEKARVAKREAHKYSDKVEVHFNREAYNNEDLLYDWLNRHFRHRADTQPYLLVMDVATFHKTPRILALLRELSIVPAMIPPGCTGMLQPLDTAVNAPLKGWLREINEQHVARREKDVARRGAQDTEPWSVSEKRIMTTWVVAAAIERLAARSDLVRKSFIDTGISIKPDGSEDHLINIKDIRSDQIDWNGWRTENQNEITGITASHDEDEDEDDVEDDELFHGPVPNGWSFTDQLLADDDSIYPSLSKSPGKGNRRPLTENSAASKRARKAHRKQAKGKSAMDKENMSPEVTVAPKRISVVRRTGKEAKGKGIMQFR